MIYLRAQKLKQINKTVHHVFYLPAHTVHSGSDTVCDSPERILTASGPLSSVLSSWHLCSFTLQKERSMGKKNQDNRAFWSLLSAVLSKNVDKSGGGAWREQEEMAPNWLHEEEEDKAKEASW